MKVTYYRRHQMEAATLKLLHTHQRVDRLTLVRLGYVKIKVIAYRLKYLQEIVLRNLKNVLIEPYPLHKNESTLTLQL